MSTMDQVMMFALGPVLIVGSWVVAYLVWIRQREFYDRTWVVHIFVGKTGRYGFDAALPMFAVMATSIFLGIVAMELYLGPMKESIPLIQWTGAVLLATGLAAMVAAYGLLLFMWPRFLAPPHLREKRGWIPQSWHQRRTRRQVRQASSS